MATDVRTSDVVGESPPAVQHHRRSRSARQGAIQAILAPLASLKLTVALFGLAIFLVFAGTLAQASHDVWWVLHNYFRSPLAWIDIQVFFPPAWFPSWQHVPGGFYFPGGFTIGGLMAVNLLTAHGVRFKIQAQGTRVWGGLAVIAAGCFLLWLVIAAGPGTDGVQAAMPIEWKTLWRLFLIAVGAGCVGIAALLGTLGDERKTERRLLGIVGVLMLALLAFLLFKIDINSINPDSMRSAVRILWQVIEAGAAALVLLAGCILVFRKRAGIVLLHAGIGLIMANELVVHFLHKEAQMTISEGQTANFASDIRTAELAIVDHSLPDQDNVVVIPQQELLESTEKGPTIVDSLLPFNVKMERFYQNSNFGLAKAGEYNPADAGAGRALRVIDEPPITGADSGERVNVPAGYVRLTEKGTGKSLGTYLVGPLLSPQKVNVGDKQYEIALRFQRDYKPYSMHLEQVKADMYLGTAIPRNYESHLQLVDPRQDSGRQVAIRMNEPFRYGGETFYQSGYRRDPASGVGTTTLQVVSNFGWMIPYVACMIVAIGMLAQFSQTLVRFLRRREEGRLLSTPPSELRPPAYSHFGKALPMAMALIAVAFLSYAAITPSAVPDQFNLYAFGKLPVEMGGRVQPIDTLARNSLRMISLREVYLEPSGLTWSAADGAIAIDGVAEGSASARSGLNPGDKIVEINGRSSSEMKPEEITELLEGTKSTSIRPSVVSADLSVVRGDQPALEIKIERKYQPAVQWLLDLIARPNVAANLRVFRIDNPDVLGMLGLARRQYYRYSWDEVTNDKAKLDQARASLERHRSAAYTVYEKKLAELDRRLSLFELLDFSFLHRPLQKFPSEEEYKADPQGTIQRLSQIKQRLERLPEFQQTLAAEHPPLAVPPLADFQGPQAPKQASAAWQPYSVAWMIKYLDEIRGQPVDPSTTAWEAVFDAYAVGDARAFNRAVRNYTELLDDQSPPEMSKANPAFEAWFNYWSPFFDCQWLYFTAFCLAVLGWLGWSGPLNRAAFWLIAITFAAHTFALAARMFISGRPPVTNLYSSAIFIGWAGVLGGLILEIVYRRGYGNVMAAVNGFATLLIADKLSLVLDSTQGDTIGVMQAVLDTQFWLATHVTCVTLGYTATLVAGLLGLIYLVRGLFTPTLGAEDGKNLARMIYGTVCFAIFFSFVGTVLGGLWADDSWGRFWGWDPKENGALMIVLWNALVLHARWDGLVKDRGLALLAIGGNIVTSWSWFGVNQLGVGLHSYGFTEGVLVALGAFCASQLLLIAVGLTPRRYWWSNRRAGEQMA